MILRSTSITLQILPNGVTLYPGDNHVDLDPETLAGWRENNAGFRGALTAGLIAVLEGAPSTPEDPATVARLGFDPKGVTFAQAKEAIAEETDVGALRAWRALETRKGIQGVLDARILALDPPKDA